MRQPRADFEPWGVFRSVWWNHVAAINVPNVEFQLRSCQQAYCLESRTYVVKMLSLPFDAFVDFLPLLRILKGGVQVPCCSLRAITKTQNLEQSKYLLAILYTLHRIDHRNMSSVGLVRVQEALGRSSIQHECEFVSQVVHIREARIQTKTARRWERMGRISSPAWSGMSARERYQSLQEHLSRSIRLCYLSTK